MSDSLSFYPLSSKSQAPSPQVSLHTCEPCRTSCQQMAQSQMIVAQTKEVRDACSGGFNLRTAAVSRRHSADGTIGSGSGPGSGPGSGRGPGDRGRFHPYHRQFSEGAVAAAGCLQPCSPSISCLQELCHPDTRSHSSSGEEPPAWDGCNGSIQSSFPELPAVTVEPPCLLPQSYLSYSTSSPLQQVSSTCQYINNDQQSNGSKYVLQAVSTQSHQESTTQSLFPKPVYSYSILIFMALKNSKTGSLPVSEIYSFMTEHFPYFKTAPDGWKNSVRHNLSLNKCFVKVENKIGNSSRKGCLWALNPAKVEKMQEELHKWRRKDPVTVRKSMARPEDLERVLGEKPHKLRSLPPHTNPDLLSRVAPIYDHTSSSCTPAQLRPPCLPIRRPQYPNFHPPLPCYFPPPSPQPSSNSFTLYSSRGQEPPLGVPAAAGNLNSPTAGKMPPVYNAAVQAENGVGHRSMQDFLLEGDISYDIDMLNPSLTDLQLQGNMWEELREDSMVSAPHATTTTPTTASAPQEIRKAECGDEGSGGGRSFEQYGCLSGLHPVVHSGVESLAGYLTSSSCTTSISLL